VTVTRDFRPSGFFHQSTLPRALIHGLKLFRIWLRIREDNRFWKSSKSVSVWSMPPLKPKIRILLLFCFTGKFRYAGYSFLKSCGPGDDLKFQRGHWPRWNRLSGVTDTAEIFELFHNFVKKNFVSTIMVSAVSLALLKFEYFRFFLANTRSYAKRP
jgi:hypothetical protein